MKNSSIYDNVCINKKNGLQTGSKAFIFQESDFYNSKKSCDQEFDPSKNEYKNHQFIQRKDWINPYGEKKCYYTRWDYSRDAKDNTFESINEFRIYNTEFCKKLKENKNLQYKYLSTPQESMYDSNDLEAYPDTTGDIQLDENQQVHLYGIPGQKHFEPVWPVIAKGAIGAVLLVNAGHPDWQKDTLYLLQAFRDLVENGSVVVAANRIDDSQMQQLSALLAEHECFCG